MHVNRSILPGLYLQLGQKDSNADPPIAFVVLVAVKAVNPLMIRIPAAMRAPEFTMDNRAMTAKVMCTEHGNHSIFTI